MSKLGITGGVWRLLPPSQFIDNNWHVTDDADTFVAHVFGFNHATDNQAKTNAAFIAEAGTVANETGLMPREMAEQRAELLEALRYVENKITVLESIESEISPKAWYELRKVAISSRKAIARATGEGV